MQVDQLDLGFVLLRVFSSRQIQFNIRWVSRLVLLICYLDCVKVSCLGMLGALVELITQVNIPQSVIQVDQVNAYLGLVLQVILIHVYEGAAA